MFHNQTTSNDIFDIEIGMVKIPSYRDCWSDDLGYFPSS